MYHGRLIIRLIGLDEYQCATLTAVEPQEPLEHDVSLISAPIDSAIALDFSNTDTVIVSLQDENSVSQLDAILAARMKEEAPVDDAVYAFTLSTDIIVIADSSLVPALSTYLDRIDDIWPQPQSSGELVFHFARYLRNRKERIDAWETGQFLEASINSTPSLVWYKTRDGIHEKVNDSFCSTVNKTKDQVQGQGHAYIWDVEADDPACIESENIVMDTRRTHVSEETVQTGDSGPRLLTTYKSPLYNIDGSVMGTVGVAIDVTQERAYEQSLIEKNHSLETIFTSLECGVLTHTVDGSRIVSVNQAALDILGYDTLEDLMEQGFDMVAPSVMEEDKARLREIISTLQKEGDSSSIEYRVLHDDGSLTYVIGNIKLIRQNDELLYQRFLFDYSDERLKQTQLEAHQRDQIRALSEDYVAVCAFDLDTGDGEVLRLSVNHQAQLEQVFYTSQRFEDMIDSYILSRVTEEDRERVRKALEAGVIIEELGRADRYEIPYRVNLDGEDQYCQMTVVRAGSWEDGENHRIIIGFRNVDRQTRIENERKKMLEEALVRATRANEAKNTFLTNMSHDIRTPLNAIIGFTTLADSHVTDAERVREYLDKIHMSGEHLLDLINDILDMSKIEAGKATLDIEPYCFKDIIDNLYDMLHSNAIEHELSLTIDTSSLNDEIVLCDKLKIRQIMLNLAGNAIKFTESGGHVAITASTLPERTSEYARYRVVIEDDGIGMSPEFLENLFDPFERERTSTISGIQGTGLGMAITKNLLEMMGGSIEVESEQGKGTTFTVVLTLERADGDVEAGQSLTKRELGDERDVAEKYKGARILLVEDNMLNREIAITLLEDAGFNVDYVCDGQEAVELLSTAQPGQYDIVLMDVQMPRMNGYEATAAIRALEDPAISSLPILAVTADAFESDKQKALQCGMNGHLPKPIQIEELFRSLESLLER